MKLEPPDPHRWYKEPDSVTTTLSTKTKIFASRIAFTLILFLISGISSFDVSLQILSVGGRLLVRLWSKTRSDKKLANQCVGANINRNWDINWNENKNTSPCSDSYPGTKVFSEIESQALKEEIQNVSSDIKVFLNFHSYGQKWLSACSYSGRYEEECKSMNEIGKEAAAASSSKTRKYDYIHGASLDPNFSLSGTLIEWAKFAADIPYAFVAELPDRGATGFFLPVEEIKSVGEEIFFGVSSLLKFVQSSSNMENIKDEL